MPENKNPIVSEEVKMIPTKGQTGTLEGEVGTGKLVIEPGTESGK